MPNRILAKFHRYCNLRFFAMSSQSLDFFCKAKIKILHSTRTVQKYYHGHADISKSNNSPFLVTLKLLYSAEIQLQLRAETKG